MTSHTKTAGHSQNYINHVALVLDASSSMDDHAADVIKVADSQIQHLAQQSQIMDQETRVSIYTFSYKSDIQCLVYDKDVLRLPSISGLYHPYGMTALCSATTLAIKDLQHTWEGYGEHAFLIYVITDGFENDSPKSDITAMPGLIRGLPDHWTLAAFVPDSNSKHFAKSIGFGNENIAIWNASADNGFVEVGEIIRKSTDVFMQNRQSGIRGSKSIFNLKPVAVKDIKKALTPLTPGSYTINKVPADGRIDDFVASVTNNGYLPGKSFYQLTKLETIQSNKQIAIRVDAEDKVYMGDAARTKLGLPDNMAAKAKPGDYKDYTIFVQSGSYNRKLIGGTECLILR
jgi:von Willebrand factor type A domain